MKGWFEHLFTFWNFLMCPTLTLTNEVPSFKKILYFIPTYALLLVIGIVMQAFFGSLLATETIVFSTPSQKLTQQLPPLFFLLLAGVLIPIVEEFVFRAPMKNRLKDVIISLVCTFILFVFLTQRSVSMIYFKQQLPLDIWTLLPILLVFLFVITGYWFRSAISTNRYFRLYFYCSSLLFALLHRYDSINSVDSLLNSFFQVLPQLLLGLYYGFLRMYFGLAYSVLSHSINNTIPAFLKLIVG